MLTITLITLLGLVLRAVQASFHLSCKIEIGTGQYLRGKGQSQDLNVHFGFKPFTTYTHSL
jgi:hypothetical protein